MSTIEKVSFTVRRPTPVSRATSSGPDSDSSSYKVPSLPKHLAKSGDPALSSPLARSATSSPRPQHNHSYGTNSSDEEDEEIKDELVTGFDRFGVQRVNKKPPQKSGPLVIPPLKNRDWRELAKKRRSAAQYVPPSAMANIGKDGGGLNTHDTINSGPVLSGLQLKPPSIKQEEQETVSAMNSGDVKMEERDVDEDKEALRAILADVDGSASNGAVIDIIPTPVSEADAYKQDVAELPDTATLDDYARVPVSQFGAALLRGMGWKEGTAATRQPGKGLVEPYLPEARPALLGIGAKEMDLLDDGSKKQTKRPEKRYIPVMKKERPDRPSSTASSRDKRERSRSPRSHNTTPSALSRRNSRSRERDADRDDRRRDTFDNHEYTRDRNRDGTLKHDDYDRLRDDIPRHDRGRREGRKDRSRESAQKRHD